MTTKALQLNADLILKDLANYMTEEGISLDTVYRVMECQEGIALSSNKIAFISERIASAQAFLEAVGIVEDRFVDIMEAYNALVAKCREDWLDGLED